MSKIDFTVLELNELFQKEASTRTGDDITSHSRSSFKRCESFDKHNLPGKMRLPEIQQLKWKTINSITVMLERLNVKLIIILRQKIYYSVI